MNSLEATLVVSGLFLLRLAIPLALTLLFGLLMNSLFSGESTEKSTDQGSVTGHRSVSGQRSE